MKNLLDFTSTIACVVLFVCYFIHRHDIDDLENRVNCFRDGFLQCGFIAGDRLNAQDAKIAKCEVDISRLKMAVLFVGDEISTNVEEVATYIQGDNQRYNEIYRRVNALNMKAFGRPVDFDAMQIICNERMTK